jgi:hypothetical protein
LFKPFIMNHFSNWSTDGKSWARVKWTDHPKELERWLAAARAARDVTLVRRLLQWKFTKNFGWGLDLNRWNLELTRSYRTAASPAARAIVLDEFETWFELDEDAAIALYSVDRASSSFILKHLPSFFWRSEKRVMWQRLGKMARAAGEEDFYFALYRKLMPVENWRAEASALAEGIADSAKLNEALEARHIEGYGVDRATTLLKLLEARGRDVLPYVRAKLESSFGGWDARGKEKALADLAEARGWWDLWAAAVRVGSNAKLFNEAIVKTMADRQLSNGVRRERLKALGGASREWNWPGLGLARVHEIEDANAVLVYERYPDLIRGPLLANVMPRWWSGRERLLAAAQKAGDDDLVDRLASRYATYISWGRVWGRAPEKTDPMEESANELAAYYQGIRDRDPELFARRASNLLTRIPAYATFNQGAVLRHNALARLLFVRSFDAYLAVPAAVRDLVEGSNIHVMMLAYRVLGRPDARAGKLAAESVDILIGTLLRPIQRETRLAAFEALANAARASEVAATRIHAAARDALKLPDKKYPKDELIGLIARIVAMWPALRGVAEQPVIYRRLERAA